MEIEIEWPIEPLANRAASSMRTTVIDTRGRRFAMCHVVITHQQGEVIVGPLCEEPKSEIEVALEGYAFDVRIIKARLAFRSFRVLENLQRFQC
jgi:hypothetical protein